MLELFYELVPIYIILELVFIIAMLDSALTYLSDDYFLHAITNVLHLKKILLCRISILNIQTM